MINEIIIDMILEKMVAYKIPNISNAPFPINIRTKEKTANDLISSTIP